MTFALPTVRRALEAYLAATPGLSLDIASENASYKPTGNPYLEVWLLPATPNDAMLGSRTYIEQGVLQVSAIYPPGAGSGDADEMADKVRKRFARGTTITKDGINVVIVKVPAIARGFPDSGNWKVPVSIPWQAQVFT